MFLYNMGENLCKNIFLMFGEVYNLDFVLKYNKIMWLVRKFCVIFLLVK